MDAPRYLSWLEVDMDHAARNYRALRGFVDSGCKLCMVVKNEAYGMGAGEMAALYDRLGADQFATVDSREALRLRDAVPHKEILVLGFVYPDDVADCIRRNISVTVYDRAQAQAVQDRARALGIPARVHIKIDTGLHRLGFLPGAAGEAALAGVCAMDMLDIRGVYTHFASADDPDRSHTHRQVRRFREALHLLEEMGVRAPLVHASSTRAMVDFPEYNFHMVRLGLVTTGFHYFGDAVAERLPVRPCVGVKSTLMQIKTLPPGAAVGYGHAFRTGRETVMGVLPLGYSQGYARGYAQGGYVLCGGHRCPIIGNIAMNHCMVDLTDAGAVSTGDAVTVFGLGDDHALTIAQGAALRGTNIEEALSAFSGKLPVLHVGRGDTKKEAAIQ